MRKILVSCLALGLSGCAIWDNYKAMAEAKTAYVQCLSQKVEPVSCESLRLRYEVERQSFKDVTGSGSSLRGHSIIYDSEPRRSSSSSPTIMGPIVPDAYGPGVGMDATGRAVRVVPWP